MRIHLQIIIFIYNSISLLQKLLKKQTTQTQSNLQFQFSTEAKKLREKLRPIKFNITKPTSFVRTRLTIKLANRQLVSKSTRNPRWVITIPKLVRDNDERKIDLCLLLPNQKKKKKRKKADSHRKSLNDRWIVREAKSHPRPVRTLCKRVVSDAKDTRIGFIERDLARWHGVHA